MSGQQEDTIGVDSEARSWVIRLASGRLTAEDAIELRRWHAASPRHAYAFSEAKRHWEVLGNAAKEAAQVPRSSAPAINRSRRWLIGAGVAAAAAGVGAVAVRPPFDLWTPYVDFASDYRTGIGETRTIALSDHATVQLSTRSRLAMQPAGSDHVHLALLSGEAAIASSAGPITVAAGEGKARAASGRFNVRNDDGVVRVTCLEGVVDVSCGGRKLALHADQQVSYQSTELGSVRPIDRDEVAAWQRGLLIFRNRELSYVLDEVNRYRAGKIILLNRDAGRRPVAVASFHLDRLDEVVAQMEALYQLKVRRLPGGIVLLS